MDMKKRWTIVYFCFIPTTIFVDFCIKTNFIHKIGMLEAIFNLILIFYCISRRKSKFINNDWLLVEALLFTCVAGIISQLYDSIELLIFINIVGFYLTQFTYISIFRNEGSILPPYYLALKEWKILVFSLSFIIGFIFFLIPHIPNKLLVIGFVYATQMLILVWMGYYRPIRKKTYNEGLLGITLLIISNLFLTISLLTYPFPHVTLIYFILYANSQLFITKSILKNANLSLPSDNPL
jgi:hypothetical protein